MEIGAALLAVSNGLGLTHPVESHDRGWSDHLDFRVLVFQRQEFGFPIGGVGDEGRLVLDAAVEWL